MCPCLSNTPPNNYLQTVCVSPPTPQTTMLNRRPAPLGRYIVVDQRSHNQSQHCFWGEGAAGGRHLKLSILGGGGDLSGRWRNNARYFWKGEDEMTSFGNGLEPSPAPSTRCIRPRYFWKGEDEVTSFGNGLEPSATPSTRCSRPRYFWKGEGEVTSFGNGGGGGGALCSWIFASLTIGVDRASCACSPMSFNVFQHLARKTCAFPQRLSTSFNKLSRR